MTIPRLARWSGPLLVLLFAAAVCGTLARTVPDVVDVPLGPLAPDVRTTLVLIPALTSQSSRVTRQLDFVISDRAAFARTDQIRIAIDAYGVTTSMVDAHFDLDGTTCAFQSAPRTLRFGTVLALTRRTPCTADRTQGRGRLTVVLSGNRPASARVGVWMAPVVPGQIPLMRTDEREPETPGGHATHYRSANRIRVSALLSWMWNVNQREFWAHVTVGLLLVLAGAVLISRGASVASAACAACCLASGIALLYVIAVPPLQAPDETDHLLSFAKLIGRDSMPAAEETWARRVHFDRIVFRASERFTEADRDRPWYRAWDATDVFAEDVAHRSITAARFWRALAAIPFSDPAHVLLRVRTADALVLGLAFGAGVTVLALSGAPVPVALALVLLAIPALPFFAMQMSEITWSIAAFVLIAFACASLLAGRENVSAGVALGSATALLAAGTRAGWPSAATIAAAAAAHIVAGSPKENRRWLFWVGFVSPTMMLFGTRLLRTPTPWYNQWHLPGLDPRFPVDSAWVITAVVMLGAAGYICELAWSAVLDRTHMPLRPFWRVSAALAVWIVATVGLSLVVQLPSMPTLELSTEMPLHIYLVRLLECVLTTPRAAGADFYAWTTFLSGFGWLDTFLAERLLTIITLLGALSALWLLTSGLVERDGRRAAIIAIVIAGIVITVIGCGVGAYGLNRTLHGRYLLGPYLAAIGLLGAGPAVLPARRVSPLARTLVLLTFVLGIHVTALWVIASRYFG